MFLSRSFWIIFLMMCTIKTVSFAGRSYNRERGGDSIEESECSGKCGGPREESGLSCYCDDSCGLMGDCCSDYETTCLTARSCKGICGEEFKFGVACHCDDHCEDFKNCCDDYFSIGCAEKIVCENGDTTSSHEMCTGHAACDDLKDEPYGQCTKELSDYSGIFTCVNYIVFGELKRFSIPISQVCDGVKNCEDNSDESKCG